MADNRENPNPKPDSDGTINLSRKPHSRRVLGLSARLKRPLSLESNVEEAPPDGSAAVDAPVGEPSPAADASTTSSTTDASTPPSRESPAVSSEQLKTRQVAGQTSAHAREGLLPIGAQLQDRYKILGVIGIGGMGAVYKAQDLRFPGVMRLCAVKEMINTATDPQVRQMIVRNFEREASILATLSHPSIPQVYDYFTEGSRSYLVIEFVSGKDLEARLAESDGFFSESLVVDWAVQLCDVLSYLHNHRPRPIIFRDLKPSNIMLDDHQRIRLVDFGIAKLFQSGEKGTMIGTEGYSPPEQYRGVAEPRGDVYALGATMHHLLSKQDPRLEPPFSFQERPIHTTNPTVSRELVEVIEKALVYDINQRWGSAEEFRRALMSTSSARGLTAAIKRGETAAFSSGGVTKPLWRFACEDEIRGSVTVAGETLLVPSYDHNVYALDVEEGEFLWKYPAEGGIASSPVVSEGAAIFGSTDHVIYAVDVKTGQLLWTVPTEGRIFSSPYAELGHVFIGSDDNKLYAIHSLSGRTSWTHTADAEVRSQPFVNDTMILFSCQLGTVYALDLDRKLRWRFRARRDILASPALHDGLVFIGSLDWNMYALDERSGWSAWKYRAGGPIVSTAGVWGGMIFFGSADNYVYALQASDGRVVWRYETEGQVTASPEVYEGAVYIGGVDGAMYCLDATTGHLRWRYQTDGPITGRPRAHNGVVYCGSTDHYVYALPA